MLVTKSVWSGKYKRLIRAKNQKDLNRKVQTVKSHPCLTSAQIKLFHNIEPDKYVFIQNFQVLFCYWLFMFLVDLYMPIVYLCIWVAGSFDIYILHLNLFIFLVDTKPCRRLNLVVCRHICHNIYMKYLVLSHLCLCVCLCCLCIISDTQLELPRINEN